MIQRQLKFRHLIGKITRRSIFSDTGVLLLPSNTILTLENINQLLIHGVNIIEIELATTNEEKKVRLSVHDTAIDNTVTELREIFEEVKEVNKVPLADLRKNVIPIIQQIVDETNLNGLLLTMQTKDDYTYRHNIAVSAISGLIGRWMGLNQKELSQLTTAAVLHDVGKLFVPGEILNKPGKLTDDEFEQIKKHTIYGYETIKNTVGLNHRQALVALQHHERLDGSGYPFGVTKDKIDLFSRIVAVADVFHAMTSNRVYRNASPFYEVLSLLNRESFESFDPLITRVFSENIMNSLIGHSVKLVSGQKGKIIYIPKNNPLYPIVQVDNKFIDLSKHTDLKIKKVIQ